MVKGAKEALVDREVASCNSVRLCLQVISQLRAMRCE
jgi:hypothetical protein